MQAQLAELHKTHEYAAITVRINQFREGAAGISCRFSTYTGKDGPRADDETSIEKCFESMAKQTPKSIAELKRDQAAKLLAEADAIETKAATI